MVTDAVAPSGERASFDTYVEGFLGLVRQGRPEPVRDLLVARLECRREPLHGLCSPPLTLHEPDQLPLLFHIYRRLEKEAPEPALAYFRRVLMELYCDTLHRSGPVGARLGELARLVAYCHVADTPSLARQLLCILWGYLTTRLPLPLEDLLELPPADRERARAALDLWVATARPNFGGVDPESGMTPPHVTAIKLTMKRVLETLPNSLYTWPPDALDLLFLLYRAVVKATPEEAGKYYFGELCRLAGMPHALCQDPLLPARWQGLCWRSGRILETNADWKNLFLKGLRHYCCGLSGRADQPPGLNAALRMLGPMADPLRDVVGKSTDKRKRGLMSLSGLQHLPADARASDPAPSLSHTLH